MRHLKAGRKLNRSASHRRALFRNLVTALLDRECIRTTDAKAKEIRRLTDRMITLGKRGTLADRRRALSFVRSRGVVKKLFDEIAPRFKGRAGGYTRVIKIGIRHGDAAPISVIELTERAATHEQGEGEKKKRGAKAAARTKGKGAEPAAPRRQRAAAG